MHSSPRHRTLTAAIPRRGGARSTQAACSGRERDLRRLGVIDLQAVVAEVVDGRQGRLEIQPHVIIAREERHGDLGQRLIERDRPDVGVGSDVVHGPRRRNTVRSATPVPSGRAVPCGGGRSRRGGPCCGGCDALLQVFVAALAAFVGRREHLDRRDEPALESIADLHREVQDRFGHDRRHADRRRRRSRRPAPVRTGCRSRRRRRRETRSASMRRGSSVISVKNRSVSRAR